MAKCLSGASDWYCTGIFDRGTPATNSFSGTPSHWSGSPAVWHAIVFIPISSGLHHHYARI
jgi:hypothetical protein